MKKILISLLAVIIILATTLNFVTPISIAAEQTGTLTIRKVSSDDTDVLIDDVQFKIYKVSDAVETVAEAESEITANSLTPVYTEVTGRQQGNNTSNATGTITITNVPVGTYYVVEGTRPAEIVGDYAKFLITMPLYEVVNNVVTANYNVEVMPKNQLGTNSITVNVKDARTNVAKSGVTYELKYGTTHANVASLVDNTITTASGEIVIPDLITSGAGSISLSNLPVGHYQLIQTAAPTGYIVDKTPVYFEVKAGDTGLVIELQDSTGTIITDTTALAEQTTTRTIEKPVLVKGKVLPTDYDITKPIDYIIKVTYTPENISKMDTYKVIDKHPAGLVVDTSTITVSGLTKTTDYTITYLTDPEDSTQKILTILLTYAGSAKLATQTDGVITIRYEATVNTSEITASTDTVTNTAKLVYTSEIDENGTTSPEVVSETDPEEEVSPAIGTDTQDETENPTGPSLPEGEDSGESEIQFYGLNIKKTDKSGNIITTGAQFQLARVGTLVYDETEGRLEDNSGNAATLVTGVVDSTSATTFTTNASGIVNISGLPAGTYYLYETVAPTYTETVTEDGNTTTVTKAYVKLRKPVQVTVGAASSVSTQFTEVENSKPSLLPVTGAACTIGLIVIGAAMAIYGYRLLKKED